MSPQVPIVQGRGRRSVEWRHALSIIQWSNLNRIEKIITTIAVGTQIGGKYVNTLHQRKTGRG